MNEEAGVPPAPSEPPGRRAVDSLELFRGGRELVIRHGSDEYRLRITRSDKLILTK